MSMENKIVGLWIIGVIANLSILAFVGWVIIQILKHFGIV